MKTKIEQEFEKLTQQELDEYHQIYNAHKEYDGYHGFFLKQKRNQTPKKELNNESQEFYNQHVANGGNLGSVPKDKLENVPQTYWNKRATITKDSGLLIDFPKEIAKNVPKEIKHPTERARQAVILFALGKIQYEDLPADVFVNYVYREQLLTVLEIQRKQQFKALCEAQNFTEVPLEVKNAFDDLLVNIYDSVMSRIDESLKEIETKYVNEKNEFDRIKESIDTIKSWENL